MDRSIVETDPHAVIEGMLIGACARRRAPRASSTSARSTRWRCERLQQRASTRRASGACSGKDILGTGIDVRHHDPPRRRRLRLRRVHGAHGLDGGPRRRAARQVRPHRRVRLPRPADRAQQRRDLGQRPAIVAQRAPSGSPRSAPATCRESRGAARSGTKVFSLVGNIRNTGLVEVPMGITLREIVFDIGGGIPERPDVQGGADRRPLGRLPARVACSTCRWTSTR